MTKTDTWRRPAVETSLRGTGRRLTVLTGFELGHDDDGVTIEGL